MKKFILVALLGLSLGGCQTMSTISAINGFSVTQNQLDGARNTYDGTALATLHTYASWPRCKAGTSLSISNRCHDAALLKKMRNADKAVQLAIDTTQNQITSGNGSGAVAAWNTLQTAITAMKDILAQNSLSGI